MLLTLVAYILLLNFFVNKISVNKRQKLIYSAFITFFLLPPIAFLIILMTGDIYTASEMGARVLGFVSAFIAFINGLIFLLIVAYFKKAPAN